MNGVQKTFTIKLKTPNTDINRDTIRNFLQNAIKNSEYKYDLIFSVDTEIGIHFNFLNDCRTLETFITSTKEDFLKVYPYFVEEYDFCLSEFNKNPQEVLIDLLENTNTIELAEPYKRTPDDFRESVGDYIRDNFSLEEQADFLKLVVSKGLKVII